MLFAGIAAVSVVLLLIKLTRNFLVAGELWVDTPSSVSVNGRQLTLNPVSLAVFNAIIIFPFIAWMYGTLFHFARVRHMERQKSQLEKEKLLAELQQLKGIVNPHFLFNNLNSLSALISENPPQAEAFLNELTKVFRYLLRNNNAEVSTVAEELHFIRSYSHLLQTRYGEGITMDVNVSEEVLLQLLPPLTLQLLVENAVKHNRVRKDQSLHIRIFNNGFCELVVCNNISKREQLVESTGIGLHSINTRLRLLKQGELTITKNEDLFQVVIPLITAPASAQVLFSQTSTKAVR